MSLIQMLKKPEAEAADTQELHFPARTKPCHPPGNLRQSIQNIYLHAPCHEDRNVQPSPKPFIPSLLLPVDRSSL